MKRSLGSRRSWLVGLVLVAGCGEEVPGAAGLREAAVAGGDWETPDGQEVFEVVVEVGRDGGVKVGGREVGDELKREVLVIADGMEKEAFFPEAGTGPPVPAEWLRVEVAEGTAYSGLLPLFEQLMARDAQVSKVLVVDEEDAVHLRLPRDTGTGVGEMQAEVLLLEPGGWLALGELGDSSPVYDLQTRRAVAVQERGKRPGVLPEAAAAWLEAGRYGLCVRPGVPWSEVRSTLRGLEGTGFDRGQETIGHFAPIVLEPPVEHREG